jgi:hypothetical protein
MVYIAERRIFRQAACTDDVARLTLIFSLLKIEDVNNFDIFHLKIVLFLKYIKTRFTLRLCISSLDSEGWSPVKQYPVIYYYCSHYSLQKLVTIQHL